MSERSLVMDEKDQTCSQPSHAVQRWNSPLALRAQ